ncbi:11798_t:CDS:10, partial [Acaulospora morrowiae]
MIILIVVNVPDNNQGEQGFCSFFRSLPEKPGNTIRLFERSSGEYYSVHGEDAIYISQNVYKTSSVIKYLGGDIKNRIPSCTLSRFNLETFLRDALLNNQMKIEIWGQESRKNSAWKIIKKASPGNIQELEDLLFSNVDAVASPVVLSVKLGSQGGQKIVGVAFADTTIRELGVSEFLDNDLCTNFESLLIQLGVKECIVQTDESRKDYDLLRLKDVVDRCGVVITELKKSEFSIKDIEQDLNRLLGDEISVASLPEYEMKNAMAACACVIKYLSLMIDESNFGHYTLRNHDLSQYMRLDSSALRALNLMPSPQDGSNKTTSLFGLLNKCKTSQGSRLLGQWLKQPLMNIKEIEQRLSLVEMFVDDTEVRQSLREDNLKSIPDLHRIAKRFQRGNATLQDVIRVYQVIIRLPELINVLESLNTTDSALKSIIEEVYLIKLREHSEQLEKLKEMVETTVDFEAAENHHYVIKADFDDRLKDIRERIDEVMETMNKEHQKAGKDLDMDIEKKLHFEKQNTYGHCFRISRNDATCLRGQSKYIELATQRNGVFFTTSKLKEL